MTQKSENGKNAIPTVMHMQSLQHCTPASCMSSSAAHNESAKAVAIQSQVHMHQQHDVKLLTQLHVQHKQSLATLKGARCGGADC